MVERYTIGDLRTNTYVLSKNGHAIIIDPSLDFYRIVDKIKSEYIIDAVLITHAHIDHIDGIKELEEYPIYISRIDYLYLNSAGYTLYGWYNEELPFNPLDLNFHFLEDMDEIVIGEFKFKCYHTPGHTFGGMCFQYEDCIFTGDTLFAGTVGRTDLPGGNALDMNKSIAFILENFPDETILYPGHDIPTNVKIEKETNPYYLMYKKTSGICE